MKAYVIEDYCEEPNFVLRDVELPSSLTDNQILVRMKAASVNPADNHLRSGHVRLVFKLKFPCVMGKDGSGIVEKIGSNVTRFQVGDEVCGLLPGGNMGTQAEYCIFEENDLVKKPEEMSHEQAGAFGVVAGTVMEMYRKHPLVCQVLDREVENAWNGEKLSETAPEERKELRILIIGASGGTGCVAVLFAKFLDRYFKTKVYAVCSEKNVALVKSLGADVVIDYLKTSAKNGSQDYHKPGGLPSICETIKNDHGDDYVDLVLDCAGGYYFYNDVTYNFSCSKANPRAIFASIIPPGPAELTLSTMLSTGYYLVSNLLKGAWSSSYPKYHLVSFFGKKERDLHLVINHVLTYKKGYEKVPLTLLTPDKLNQAHEMIATKRTVGKIVIRL